jgi:hypothetical protein
LIGGGAFVYALFHGITHATDSLTQIVVPGSAELTLRQGQLYTVFLEDQATVNGKIYSTTQSISGLTCRVSSVEKGTPLAIKKSSANVSYTVGSRSGHSVLEFPVQEAGRYLFSCDYGEKSQGPETVVAVGTGVGEAIVRTVLGSLAAMFGGGGLGVIVIVFVLIKREREKKRIWLSQVQQQSSIAP